jgi:hypothetical protein
VGHEAEALLPQANPKAQAKPTTTASTSSTTASSQGPGVITAVCG